MMRIISPPPRGPGRHSSHSLQPRYPPWGPRRHGSDASAPAPARLLRPLRCCLDLRCPEDHNMQLNLPVPDYREEGRAAGGSDGGCGREATSREGSHEAAAEAIWAAASAPRGRCSRQAPGAASASMPRLPLRPAMPLCGAELSPPARTSLCRSLPPPLVVKQQTASFLPLLRPRPQEPDSHTPPAVESAVLSTEEAQVLPEDTRLQHREQHQSLQDQGGMTLAPLPETAAAAAGGVPRRG